MDNLPHVSPSHPIAADTGDWIDSGDDKPSQKHFARAQTGKKGRRRCQKGKGHDSLSSLIAQREEAALQREAVYRELKMITRGIPAGEMRFYSLLIDAQMASGMDFDAALDWALRLFPIEANGYTNNEALSP